MDLTPQLKIITPIIARSRIMGVMITLIFSFVQFTVLVAVGKVQQ